MSIITSVRWIAVSQGVKVTSQLVSMAVLARLLPLESYGVMAMAMTAANFAYLFRDLGTTTALIQRTEITESLKNTIYWINIALGIGLSFILIIFAYPIASGFKQKELAIIIVVLSFVFPISCVSLVQQAILERASRFRLLARIEVVSATVGLASAIVLAYLGAGVWSLVGQILIATLLNTLQLVLASEWRPKRLVSAVDFKTVWKFSADLSLVRLITYLESNADSMIIGRILGPLALGVYATALKIMLFPLQNLTAVATRALLPAMSHHSGSQEELGAIYLRSVTTIAILTAPLMTGLYYLREPFVMLLFGSRWDMMPAVLQWLAPVGFIQSLTTGTAVVFISLGQSRRLLLLGMLGAILLVSAFVVGVQWGITGVAACYFAANFLNFWPCFILSLTALKISLTKGALAIACPLLASAAMLLALYFSQSFVDALHLPLFFTFIMQIFVGAVSYTVVLLSLSRRGTNDLLSFFRLKNAGNFE